MSELIALHNAYKRGYLETIRALMGNPADFPNSPGPLAVGAIPLQYAIFQSPVAFVRRLLELGADPNYHAADGFPSLIAALSSERPDSFEIVKLLLHAGADIQQRGVNDATPLH